jgi:hypothetical protein
MNLTLDIKAPITLTILLYKSLAHYRRFIVAQYSAALFAEYIDEYA